MKTKIIPCLSRAVARSKKAEVIALGKFAKVIDNGSAFTGLDRWGLEVEDLKLAAPRKPTHKPFAGLHRSFVAKATTSQNYLRSHRLACNIPVYTKRGRV